MITKLIIEQHFHGAFGVDFNKASVDDILELSYEIRKVGVGGIFPTLVTDTVENIKKQIAIIKRASEKQTPDMAKIFGVHLEAIFLNPSKKGIHDSNLFLTPNIENFNKISDDIIKIVTLAPELADIDFLKFLKSNKIKIQAGHCVGGDLSLCSGVTHTFNAMSGISHRGASTALSALVNDNLYTEIIADGVHVSNDALKLLFKAKPLDKIILVSDCLSCTHSNVKKFIFAGEEIYFDGEKAFSKDETLAGSTKLLPDIIKILASKNLFNPKFITNPYVYHGVDLDGEIEFDEEYNIIRVK